MAPPYRFEPPPCEGAVARPRVHRLLRGRWDHRVTAVVAGAGMGKTTAVAMAVAEDRLEARGVDVWLTCMPDDADAEHLRDGLLGALAHQGLPTGGDGGPQAVLEALGAAAPDPVCLVLDGVEALPDGSSGAALLADLVARLPGHAHLVLSARCSPPIGLTRLAAQGEVLRVGGADLRYLPGEAPPSAAGQAPGAGTSGEGGWPALVALAAGGDPRAPHRFVEEEVLAALSDAQARVLAACSLVGGAPVELLGEFVDAGPDDVDVVAELPLVAWDERGWLVPDPLWRRFTAGRLPAEARQTALRRCTAEARSAGDLDRALTLALTSGDDHLVRQVLAELVGPDRPLDADALAAALSALSEEVRHSPEGLLLQGLVLAARDPGAATADAAYRRAAGEYRARGDVEGEARALAQLAYLAHVHRDAAALGEVLARLGELQRGGSVLAASTTMLGGALLALSAGDAQRALHTARALTEDELPPPWDVVAHWVEATACINLGLDARDAAARLAARQRFPLPGMQDRGWLARLRAGELVGLLDAACPGLEEGASDRDRHLAALVTAGVRAITGRTEEAARLLALAERVGTSHSVPAAVVNRAVVRAALADALHDDERAVRFLREGLEVVPLDSPQRASWYPAIHLLLCHVGEAVEDVEALELSGSWAVDRRLARAAAALRAGAPTTVVHDLAWPAPGAVVRAVALRSACLLAAAGLAEDHPRGTVLARWLLTNIGEPARGELRLLADDPRVGAAVRRLLGEVAVRPAAVRRLALLGAPTLHIGDVAVESSDWRRQRVQQLIAYLVLHGRSSRDALVDALWPDAGLAAGRRSLRSTMNYLLGVLEPDRVGGEASWFVRTDGDHVEPADDALLEVDVARLEQAVAAAGQAERDGVFSLARAEHDRVVDLWRGLLLEGHPEEGWVAAERRRLGRLVVASAVRAGQLHLAAGEVASALDRGGRALDVDPWCEPAHRLVVRVHLDTGNRAAARAAAGRCRDALLDLGVRPQPQTAELVRDLTTPVGG